MSAPFLTGERLRPLAKPLSSPFTVAGYALGPGKAGLEVLVASSPAEPNWPRVRTLWKERNAGQPSPLIVAVSSPNGVTLCGAVGDDPPLYRNVDPGLADRLCREALAQPDRHAALRFLRDALPAVESRLPGVRNEGFLATHQLEIAPKYMPWGDAATCATPLLGLRDEAMLRGLGFTQKQGDGLTTILSTGHGKEVAVAVLLNEGESFDDEALRFTGMTPVSYAIAVADREKLPYVLVSHGPRLRLYPVGLNAGVGRRGRTETFVEFHAGLVADKHAAYLWLLFSEAALAPGGHLDKLMAESLRYAGELATRLRERIYEQVVPALAKGIVAARGLKAPTAEDLAQTYQMVMTVLFRLLFVAYAEDKDLLPYRHNGLYQRRSLKELAKELITGIPEESLWKRVDALCRAVAEGNAGWGVPAYGGDLFERDAAVSAVGGLLAGLELPNSVMGPVLRGLLLIETAEGVLGPVDFRSLGVREFGTVYEGLLESELAVAETDLAVDREGYYRPWREKEIKLVQKGDVYLHNRSGARKATGTYFTKQFAVDHLLDQALEAALADHAERLKAMGEADAAERFFDFRVADIAMGSAHFLVAAVDRIERAFTRSLADRPLAGVRHELASLRESARTALGKLAETVSVEDTPLLRRLIARRCIYGVDMNPVAVTLARLSIWTHTFVPGLPLSLLDHNLVCGNSLVGIGTVAEIEEKARGGRDLPMFPFDAEKLVGEALEPLKRLARAADATVQDVKRARAAIAEARAATRPAEALCDIVTAARVEGEPLPLALDQWDAIKATLPGSPPHQHALEALAALPPFHFPVAFPEVFLRERSGFDVLLGNPPWKEAKLEEDVFWMRYSPGFKALTLKLRADEKEKLKGSRPDLVKQFQEETAYQKQMQLALLHGPYPGMGVGDADLYKAFCWRFWHLTSACGGRIGVVLPRSAFSVKGSEPFRRHVFKSANPLDLTMLVNNRGWVFPSVHFQYTVSLTSLCRKDAQGKSVLLRGPFSSQVRFNAGAGIPGGAFTAEEAASWSDSAALPLLPSEQSLEVFNRLRLSPRLTEEHPLGWHVRGLSEELHSKKEQHVMREGNKRAGDWPVYKGESFDLWKPDTGTYYGWADPKTLKEHLQSKRLNGSRNRLSPFSTFASRPGYLTDLGTLPCVKARIAIRRMSRATDTRTVRAALIPPRTALADQASTLLWPRGDEKDEAYVLGILCSLTLDWYARRFVETDVRMHIINPLPVSRPPRTSPLWQRVVSLAGRLACPDERFAEWAKAVGVECGPLDEAEKQDKIHELDAVVAHLYGLSEKQLAHVFETFHEGWDYTGRLGATLVHFRRWA